MTLYTNRAESEKTSKLVYKIILFISVDIKLDCIVHEYIKQELGKMLAWSIQRVARGNHTLSFLLFSNWTLIMGFMQNIIYKFSNFFATSLSQTCKPGPH